MRTASNRHAAQQFAIALNRGLFRYYGRNPPAATVARDFNSRSGNGVPISQEASRKWMRGHTIPGLAKMQVLAKWLDLDLRAIDGGDEITPVREAPAGDPDGPASLDSVPDAVLRRRLLQSIEDLDRPRAELMLTVMLGLIRLSATQARMRFANSLDRVDPTVRPVSRTPHTANTANPANTAQTNAAQFSGVTV
jgi:hypothetical protein